MDDRIIEILTDYVDTDPSAITEDADLRADLGMDSLQLADLATRLETEYGVVISDRDAMNIRTVGDAMKIIEG
ncbi:MAG: acyl carrier protein [Oscillospiraceae bacterium]|nr:acyl carrier protein [Oscillospiraceae bacterium]